MRRCFIIDFKTILLADDIVVNTVHINAGCIAFLSSCSANSTRSLRDAIVSVEVPNHAGNAVTCQNVMLFSRFYTEAGEAHPMLNLELETIFPDIKEMISFLDGLGINQFDYRQALEVLSQQKDLQFD